MFDWLNTTVPGQYSLFIVLVILPGIVTTVKLWLYYSHNTRNNFDYYQLKIEDVDLTLQEINQLSVEYSRRNHGT